MTISDAPHVLELDWKAASSAGANNGVLTLWVDEAQQGSFTNLDNDTRWIDFAQWGIVGGVDIGRSLPAGSRGTLYFDAFESRRDSYIGLAAGAPAPPPFPERTDTLFADSFEAGDLSAWSYSAIDGGDLSVSSQAAITGSYGLQALLDDNASIYITDWSPFEEARYRARFYFDPNSIPMTSGNAHYIFYALDRDSHPLLRVELRYSAPDYQVRADAVNDNWSWGQTAWVTISDAPHLLELDWQAATAAGANNGVLTFWVDEAQQGSFTNIDNDTRRVDYVQLGAVNGVDNGSRGTMYFNAFESRRESYIGLTAINSGMEQAAQISAPLTASSMPQGPFQSSEMLQSLHQRPVSPPSPTPTIRSIG